VAEWHGEACLRLRLTLATGLSAATQEALVSSGSVQLSHPSVASFRVLGILPGT